METVEFRMKVTFRKMGNSTMVTIPAEIISSLNIEQGQEGVIESGELEDGRIALVITPIREEPTP